MDKHLYNCGISAFQHFIMVRHASPADGDGGQLARGVHMILAASLAPPGPGGQGGSHHLDPLGQDPYYGAQNSAWQDPLKQAVDEGGVGEHAVDEGGVGEADGVAREF